VGRVENSSGHREASVPHFLRAHELAEHSGEEALAVDAAHMLAIVETGAKQLEWHRRAIELAEGSSDPSARKWLGSLYNNLGWTYHDAGDFTVALEAFEKALEYRKAQGTPDQLRIAQWAVARCLRSLGKFEDALHIQRSLESAGTGKDGYVYEEIAECLLASGNEAAARPYFAKAYQELSQDAWLASDQPQRVERLKRMGSEGPTA
jgi:tetratricopeptide (TPR) repeat protein